MLVLPPISPDFSSLAWHPLPGHHFYNVLTQGSPEEDVGSNLSAFLGSLPRGPSTVSSQTLAVWPSASPDSVTCDGLEQLRILESPDPRISREAAKTGLYGIRWSDLLPPP
jgi:hypothetical protein